MSDNKLANTEHELWGLVPGQQYNDASYMCWVISWTDYIYNGR